MLTMKKRCGCSRCARMDLENLDSEFRLIIYRSYPGNELKEMYLRLTSDFHASELIPHFFPTRKG